MTLEEINTTTEYKLPFEIISDVPPLKILDYLFSNYEISSFIGDICDETGISLKEVQVILDNFLQEKIIKQEKHVGKYYFLANFNSPKTMGLFQYYRAVLDENLERLAYKKVNLK